jgi:hypothetical protein
MAAAQSLKAVHGRGHTSFQRRNDRYDLLKAVAVRLSAATEQLSLQRIGARMSELSQSHRVAI